MTPRTWLWLAPFACGALLAMASLAWIAMGEPFDQTTHARIAGQDWPTLAASSPEGLLRVLSAVVRLQGGTPPCSLAS